MALCKQITFVWIIISLIGGCYQKPPEEDPNALTTGDRDCDANQLDRGATLEVERCVKIQIIILQQTQMNALPPEAAAGYPFLI